MHCYSLKCRSMETAGRRSFIRQTYASVSERYIYHESTNFKSQSHCSTLIYPSKKQNKKFFVQTRDDKNNLRTVLTHVRFLRAWIQSEGSLCVIDVSHRRMKRTPRTLSAHCILCMASQRRDNWSRFEEAVMHKRPVSRPSLRAELWKESR